jgi:hypothetical protein
MSKNLVLTPALNNKPLLRITQDPSRTYDFKLQIINADNESSASHSNNIHEWLSEHSSATDEYDQIGVFNQPCEAKAETIERWLHTSAELNTSILQPAVSIESESEDLITRSHKSFFCRWTNHANTNIAVYKSKKLIEILPMLKNFKFIHSEQQPNIQLWKELIGGVMILDAFPIKTGQAASTSQGKDEKDEINDQVLNIMKGLSKSQDNICGISQTGRFMHLGEAQFAEAICTDALNIGLNAVRAVNLFGTQIQADAIYQEYCNNIARNLQLLDHIPQEHPPQELLDLLTEKSISASLIKI